MFGYNKPQLMAIVFCHKERGISVEEENHLVTVGIVKKSKTILVLLASPIVQLRMLLRARNDQHVGGLDLHITRQLQSYTTICRGFCNRSISKALVQRNPTH